MTSKMVLVARLVFRAQSEGIVHKSFMSELRKLENQIVLLKREHGDVAARDTCDVLEAFVRWVRTEGHGNVTLSAFDHKVSRKFRTETVVTVEKDSDNR